MITDMLRCFMAVVQPLTGERATGTLRLRAIGADVVVPHRRWLAPVIKGELRHNMAVKLGQNPNAANGAWTVTAAGVSVPAHSVVGGARHNLIVKAAGAEPATQLRWLGAGGAVAPDAGVEAVVECVGDFTGATTPTGFGGVMDVGFYEQVRMPFATRDLLRANLSELPAVVFTWADSGPAEGSAGDHVTQYGVGQNLFRERFQAVVIANRHDSDPSRRDEGLQIMEDVADLLTWRQAVDGVPFSHPEPVQILGRGRARADEDLYVYVVNFRSTMTLSKHDSRTFSAWLKSRVQVKKPDDAGAIGVADVSTAMPQ